MTKFVSLAFLISIAAACALFAQESPSPTETAYPTPEQTASPSPSASTARNVQLRFVPPPMEGTISLGIFDSNDKLVRVLYREAKVDNFTIDENALKTTWDGKNDAGEDLPAGKYRARGYLVGKLKIELVGKADVPAEPVKSHVPVKLVMNPLVSDTRAVMDVGVGFDDKGSFLKTMDGLPLFTVSTAPGISDAGISKVSEREVDVWVGRLMVESESTIFSVSNIDKMMAFDCGFFELK